MANTYTLIASNTLSSSAASVTFSAIPNTYTDLVLRASIRATNATVDGNLYVKLNNDEASPYYYSITRLIGAGSSGVSSSRSSNTAPFINVGSTTGSSNTSNTFASLEFYFPSYSNSNNKVMSAFNVSENNSSADAYIKTHAGLWRRTDAITEIKLENLTFDTGSSFFLYGIQSQP